MKKEDENNPMSPCQQCGRQKTRHTNEETQACKQARYAQAHSAGTSHKF